MKELRLKLIVHENFFLLGLLKSKKVSKTTKNRIKVLLLYDEGYVTKDIAARLNLKYKFVLESYNRWINQSIDGLFDKSKNNKKPLINKDEFEYLKKLKREERSYTWVEMAEKLYEYSGKRVSPQRVRKRFKTIEQLKKDILIIYKTVSYVKEDDFIGIYTNFKTIKMGGYSIRKDIIVMEQLIKCKDEKDNLEIPIIHYKFS